MKALTLPTGTIARGALVRLRTRNGGDCIVRLASDYKPTYSCWFTGHAHNGDILDHSFIRNADDIVTVTAVPEDTPTALTAFAQEAS